MMSFLKSTENWMKIKFSFRAKREFIDSAKFYEGRVVGLGKRCKREIKNHVEVIQDQPKSGELNIETLEFK